MFKCEFIGEAMQIKKLLFFFLLVPVMIFSQEINQLNRNTLSVKSLELMSDDELKNYWDQAQENGYSLSQLKTLARAQGASESDITRFESRIKNFEKKELDSKDIIEQTQDDLSSIFGINPKKNKDKNPVFENQRIGVFGSYFFNNPNISSSPQLNVATPSSYELGPGDELVISIWGAAENEYNSKVSREGYIKIERIGPVYVSGLTITEAASKLKSKLSKIYSGLISNYNKVFFDLSLLNTRSVIVNVVGNVNAPGTYTFSSLISPLNAIYAAGGPNDNGSYREVKVIRGEEEIHSIDLYDYFAKGLLENFSLRDQDVILIPSYKKRVFLNGEFKTPGVYEVTKNETIEDILNFSGGINSFGYKDGLFIKRIDGLERKVTEINKSEFHNYKLKDGDIIEARSASGTFNNMVTIQGGVNIPGEYSIENASNVLSLIELSGGLTESAYKSRAYIFRMSNGVTNEVVSISLEDVLSGDKIIDLKPKDNLVVSSNNDLFRQKSVNIRGQVFEPDTYPFFEGMTLIDLILIAKGVTLRADLSNIEVYRSTYDKTRQAPVEGIKVSLKSSDLSNIEGENNIKLKEDDLVIIRQKEGVQEKEFVFVNGLVKTPGGYSIKNNNYTFYDLIKDFGGFLPDAALNGVKIRRRVDINSEIKELEISKLDSINIQEIDRDKIEFIEFGVNVTKILSSSGKNNSANVVLKNGDQISVPKTDNSIEISGAVQKPSVLTYSRSLSVNRSITNSGGFKQNAKKNGVYVVYQNGNVSSTKKILFFRKYPKLLPGSKIIVPDKIESTKTSIGEIVGYTTSLVSIIALIKSL